MTGQGRHRVRRHGPVPMRAVLMDEGVGLPSFVRRPGPAHLVMAALLTFGYLATPLSAQTPATPEVMPSLVLDGVLGDWDPLELPGVTMSGSGRFLVVGLHLSEPTLIQSEGAVTLTWTPDDEARAVRWDFPSRVGSSASGPVTWADVGLHVHPTVRSTAFELAFEVEALGEQLGVVPGERVGVLVEDDGEPIYSGELLWPEPPSGATPGVDLPPAPPGTLRIVSWNLQSDALFEPERRASIGRVLRALDPDLMILQELYDSTASAVREALDGVVPLESGRSWTVRKGGDVVLAARDTLERAVDFGFHDFGRAIAARWLVDGRPAAWVLGSHLPCCNGGTPPADERRAFLLDRIASLAHDLPGSALAGEGGAPMQLLLGDLNLVGEAGALDVLIRPSAPSAGVAPSRPFALVDAIHLDGEETFTWSGPRDGFTPGRLDFALVSEEAYAGVVRAFVLDDADISLPRVEGSVDRIRPGDVTRSSDHLPIVLDIRIPEADGAAPSGVRIQSRN